MDYWVYEYMGMDYYLFLTELLQKKDIAYALEDERTNKKNPIIWKG